MKLKICGQQAADSGVHIQTTEDFPKGWFGTSVCIDGYRIKARRSDCHADAQKYLPVADVWSRKQYRKFWARAAVRCRIRLLKKNGKFLPKQLERVNEEAQRLQAWCEAKHQSEQNNFNYVYMKRKIRELVRAIAEEAPQNSEPFYIF